MEADNVEIIPALSAFSYEFGQQKKHEKRFLE